MTMYVYLCVVMYVGLCVWPYTCVDHMCVCMFMLTVLGREEEIHILGHIFAFSLHLGKEVLVVKNLACLFFLEFLSFF